MTAQLTRQKAKELLMLNKYFLGHESFEFPHLGGELCIPLHSKDRREEFILDVSRGNISLAKNKFQTRAHRVVILARLDLGGASHRNPDGQEIDCPHLHVYREGFETKWAIPLPSEFGDREGVLDLMDAFLDYCHVIDKPVIRGGLFT